ncbi:MAG: hypothetical protein WA461_11355 [Nitrososphaeraceae archaeon]
MRPAARVTIDNSDKVENLVLIDSRIQNPYDALYNGVVGLSLEYAKQVLDKNHNGSFSIQEASQDQVFQTIVGDNTSLILNQSLYSETLRGELTVEYSGEKRIRAANLTLVGSEYAVALSEEKIGLIHRRK